MPATAPLLQPCQVRACACWGNYVRTGVGCVAITVGGGVAVVWWWVVVVGVPGQVGASHPKVLPSCTPTPDYPGNLGRQEAR